MTIYIDDMRVPARVGSLDATWSHLMADSTAELMTFAAQLGMRPEWLQKPGTVQEHFDLTEPKRRLAIRLGARVIRYGHEGYALMQAKRAGAVFDLDAYRAANSDEGGLPEGQLDLF